MAANEAVIRRRREVFELIQQGIKREALADKYGITVRAIDKDLTAIRKEKALNYTKLSLTERVMELEEAARQRLTRIWAILSDKASSKRDITNAIRLLQTEEELRIKRDQIAGILPRMDVNLNLNQFNMNSMDSIKIEFEDISIPKITDSETKEAIQEENVKRIQHKH